jgi:threonine synthase
MFKTSKGYDILVEMAVDQDQRFVVVSAAHNAKNKQFIPVKRDIKDREQFIHYIKQQLENCLEVTDGQVVIISQM